ncbi:protein of unknown function [Xenorhabdus poinarii G6]|uniref:Uncharacterized protein n=1 Tax=Xenorhabdus poinarii G6 TaxID=1354304 RepID=A0A068R7J9_9GAMM|nr:hypothetical protein [Xenorhabdus poinarii]CDG22100.1 protein of unknown function [Xenorhabdus poinarii G6]
MPMPDKFAPDMPISDLPIVIGYIPISFAFSLNTGMALWISTLSVMAIGIRHILYGPANFLFRYLPLRLEAHRFSVRKAGMVFDSISSLLIVSNMPNHPIWCCRFWHNIQGIYELGINIKRNM